MFLLTISDKQALTSIVSRWNLFTNLLFGICYLILPEVVRSFTTQRFPSTRISSSPQLISQSYGSLSNFRTSSIRNQQLTRRFNFFKNLIDQAFENDTSLSKKNKLEGMLIGPEDAGDDDDFFVSSSVKQLKQQKLDQLTGTQIAWRERQKSSNQVMYDDIANKEFVVDLYLTGVPNKDPSNDLYGSKTNISSRDRSIGLTVPTEPTVCDLKIAFLNGNKCQVVSDDKTGFTVIKNDSDDINIPSDDTKSNEYSVGDWKLSDDRSQIRFRIGVNGYQRIIETRGTIQKVYWSNEDESMTQTSTVYTIPSGWLYGECKLLKKPTKVVNINRIEWDENSALLKIEQKSGLLGVSTKMIPCGKFRVQAS